MANASVWTTNPVVPQALAASVVSVPPHGKLPGPVDGLAELGVGHDPAGFLLAGCRRRALGSGYKRRPSRRRRVPPRPPADLGGSPRPVPGRRRAASPARSWKNAPTIAARIAAPLPADITPLGEIPERSGHRPGSVPRPTPKGNRQNQPSSDRRKARMHASRSSGCRARALGHQRRLFGVVGDEAGPAQQPEAVACLPNRRAMARPTSPRRAGPGRPRGPCPAACRRGGR